MAFWKYLENFRQTLGRIAMFGAGRLTAMFLTVMNESGLIDFVIDNNPNQCRLFMPGSRLPIVCCDSLLSSTYVKLCLMGFNPLAEKNVMELHAAYTARGGVFKSIFSSSAVTLEL